MAVCVEKGECVWTVDVFAWWGGGNVGPDSADSFTDTCDSLWIGLRTMHFCYIKTRAECSKLPRASKDTCHVLETRSCFLIFACIPTA